MKSISIKTRSYTQTNRAQAAEATGQRIIAAFLGRLMSQWYDEITLDRVAADAATTVQTIVRRFEGKEGLLAASLQELGTQINARRTAVTGDLDRTLANLTEDYEQTGDPVLRLLALEERHPSLKSFLDYGRSEHRQWVTSVFVEPLGFKGPRHERAIDLLVVVTDVYAWKLLRRDMGHGIPATTLLMKALVQGALAEMTK